MSLVRLDKFLAQAVSMTRSEVKKEIKKGAVSVNGVPETRSERKLDTGRDAVCWNGKPVRWREHIWLMLYKPAGCVTATEDKRSQTVLDYIGHPRRGELFPVGRLDMDTEGLLLLTDDGETAHRMLSPRHHAEKTYFVRVRGVLSEADREAFAEGMDIGEKHRTLPAELTILSEQGETENISENEKLKETEREQGITEAEVTIYEGKYHQIKRMFAACGCEVFYLKRIRMAGLSLDPSLAPGEWRELTEEEMERLHILCWNR